MPAGPVSTGVFSALNNRHSVLAGGEKMQKYFLGEGRDFKVSRRPA
jgi:hypothetical protein